jgi:hypothetical protein
MEQINVVRSDEVMDIHHRGVRTGFISGVIFCLMAKYWYNRRKDDRYPYSRDRT